MEILIINVGFNEQQGFSRSIEFDLNIGAEAVDFDKIAKTEKLGPLELELRKLETIVKEIVGEMNYLKRREARMRDTNGKIKWKRYPGYMDQIVISRGSFRIDQRACQVVQLAFSLYLDYPWHMASLVFASFLQTKAIDRLDDLYTLHPTCTLTHTHAHIHPFRTHTITISSSLCECFFFVYPKIGLNSSQFIRVRIVLLPLLLLLEFIANLLDDLGTILEVIEVIVYLTRQTHPPFAIMLESWSHTVVFINDLFDEQALCFTIAVL